MRFPYLLANPKEDTFEKLPLLPMRLKIQNSIKVFGLIDSGASVNVLPYDVGIALGAIWDETIANIPIRGVFGELRALPVFATAQIGNFASIRLAFA